MKYLYIGVSGHRDLSKNKIGEYAKIIYNKLKELKENNLDKELLIVSPLADGADRLIVKEALKLNINFISPLPLPKSLYQMDFDEESNKEFETLLTKAKNWFELDLEDGNSLENIREYNQHRDKQYEAVGKYISDKSDILFVLWDGVFNNLKGGTSEILKYRLNSNKKSIYHLLVDRESNNLNRKPKLKVINSIDEL